MARSLRVEERQLMRLRQWAAGTSKEKANTRKDKKTVIKTLTPGLEITADGLREVNFELNGQRRTVKIRDENAATQSSRSIKVEISPCFGADIENWLVLIKVH